MRTLSGVGAGTTLLAPVEDDLSGSYIRQVPETEFERQLLIRAMIAEGAFLDNLLVDDFAAVTASITVGSDWDEHGRLKCWAAINKGDDSDVLSVFKVEQYPIWFFVSERPGAASAYYSLVVSWLMPANPYFWWGRPGELQTNDLPCLPVLRMPKEERP